MKKIFKLLNNNKIQLLLVVFSFFLIIISVTRALYLAQIFSFDFHYSTAKLVSEGVNHYRYILDGYRLSSSKIFRTAKVGKKGSETSWSQDIFSTFSLSEFRHEIRGVLAHELVT